MKVVLIDFDGYKVYYITNNTIDQYLVLDNGPSHIWGKTIPDLFDFDKDEVNFIPDVNPIKNDRITTIVEFNSLENYKVEIAEYLV